MAGTGGHNRAELRLLQALPIVGPALWSIPAIVALEAWCRRWQIFDEWGTRACPRYDSPAPFVRVENAVVVETGMR